LPAFQKWKLDRAALPVPEFGGGGRGPATAAERAWCGLFAGVLGVERAGAEDSFFDLGGDSIISMLLVARARQAGYAVSVRQVFELKTAAALAAAASPLPDREARQAEGEAAGEVPATPVIAWLAGLAGPGTRVCQSMVVAVPGGAGLAELERALAAVADRHPVLRARLLAPGDSDGDENGGEWRLMVPPPGTGPGPEVVRVKAGGLDGPELAGAAAAEARAAAGRLDARAGVMVQAVWLDAGLSRPGRLVLVVHHLVVDGVSWRILLPDLAAAWQAVRAGRVPVLEPEVTSFRSWARLLAARAADPGVVAELAGWAAILQGGDAPLAARSSGRAGVTVGAGTGGAVLAGVPALFHGGPQDVLLAGLAAGVAQWRRRRGLGGGGVLVDVEGHGREPFGGGVELSRTVGWFTSIYPVRLDPGGVVWDEVAGGGAAAGVLVKAVKEQVRAVPGDGLGYGLLRYLNPRTAARLAGLPVPQIGFNYLGRFPAGTPAAKQAEGPGYWLPAGGTGLGGGDPDLPAAHVLEATVTVRETAAGPELALSLSAPEELISAPALQELAGYWAAALGGIAAHAAGPGAGGHTPSDFPLLTLRQEQVDELDREFSDGD
jgi:non-ribosomal peptide synthase protein (TIGR01720 family)